MYKIEKKDYGYALNFSGLIKIDEMQKWYQECEKALIGAPSEFVVLIDMVNLSPLPDDSQQLMVKGQAMFKKKGMIRSAVLVAKLITAMQFKRLAEQSGIKSTEKYLAAENPKAMELAMDWLLHSKDPDTH